MTDNPLGGEMTIADQQHRTEQQPDAEQWRREQQQAEQRAQARRDRARAHGNQVAQLADIAEDSLDEKDVERNTRLRYEDGLQVLRFLIGADWDERVLEMDRVLHDDHAGFSKARAVEFIDLLLAGMPSLGARQAMVARHPQRAERDRVARSTVAAARVVSASLHRMAETPEVQPALPPGRPVQAHGELPALPKRVPQPVQRERIAPSEPPEFEPAPPEPDGWSTGHMLAVLRDETAPGSLSPESVRMLRDAGYGQQPHEADGPDLGPATPPGFGAAAIPQQRAGDTQRLPMDEVLEHLGMDDAGAEDAAAPLPFPVASTAVAGSRPGVAAASSGRGDSDDA